MNYIYILKGKKSGFFVSNIVSEHMLFKTPRLNWLTPYIYNYHLAFGPLGMWVDN